MLKIQRASAGSGKTYTLAKSYIINLLVYRTLHGKPKLRDERQMEDALRSILAITFTNKATNEMKQRIINNLLILSQSPELLKIKKTSPDSIPYLSELQQLTSASISQIADTAGQALKTILNNFSLFKISTIDSFFQEILRTFTYESNLNDSYQLEIDSSFISEAALDEVIHQLDSQPQTMGKAAFWLNILMKEESLKSQHWNIFNKKSSRGSIYLKLREALKQLESEDYKDIKDELDHFFFNPGTPLDLTDVYQRFKHLALNEREAHLTDIKKSLDTVESLMQVNDYPSNQISSTFLNQLEKIRSLKKEDSVTFSFKTLLKENSVFKKKYRVADHPLDLAAIKMYNLLEAWNSPSPDSYYKNWLIHKSLIPYLGLLLESRKFISKILERNNLLQLSDTNYILKKIIGEDDAPFVYERIGNRIENYLIDEFQDTSRMQWDIIRPLLKEGIAKDKESLIIGDPKQSIYRFRNADHRLITTVVPKEFPNHIEAGYSPQDNTNWRSHSNIIKFNNYLFRALAQKAQVISQENGEASSFISLYSNVVQNLHHSEGKGYVEIRSFFKPSSFADENDEIEMPDGNSSNWFEKLALDNLGPLISSLINRGYRQKDIGILVNRNSYASDVVNALITYNESLESDDAKIEFVSDESLLIASSPAIDIILGVIEKLAQPSLYVRCHKKTEHDINENLTPEISAETKAEITGGKKLSFPSHFMKWESVKTDYNIYAINHPELSPSQAVINFINSQEFDTSLSKLIKNLPSLSLSAIVESAIEIFIDPTLRKSEAIYIASFQDLVNDYSARHINDPASFLEWWKTRGVKSSVVSPEDLDAIHIMTIHKSKGLEFKCIIVPFVSESLAPSSDKSEWRWVSPALLEGLELPPFLPVVTDKKLVGSLHEKFYREYYDQVLTDTLNMYYVAFTRAKNELYVFSKVKNKSSSSISELIVSILKSNFNPQDFNDTDLPNIMNPQDLYFSEDELLITYGSPFTTKEIEEENNKTHKIQEKWETHFFKDYFVNDKRPRLRSIASKDDGFTF